jgi:hypothetical protein
VSEERACTNCGEWFTVERPGERRCPDHRLEDDDHRSARAVHVFKTAAQRHGPGSMW